MKPVLVISHPRSGTHFFINTLAVNLGFAHNQIDIKDSWAGMGCLDEVSNPRTVRKSHHQSGYLAGHPDLFENFHVFYIVRDPRAVMLSCYEYFRKSPAIFPKADSMDDFLALDPSGWPFFKPYNLLPCSSMVDHWNNHLLSWFWLIPYLSVISYHDLACHFDHTVERIALILGTNPPVNPHKPSAGRHVVCPSHGKEDRWKEVLSAGQIESIESSVHPVNRKWLVG